MNSCYASIKPAGLDIEGVIRFEVEQTVRGIVQKPEFRIDSRVKVTPTEPETFPRFVPHPVEQLLENRRVIPIRLISNNVEHTLRARYQAFDDGIGRMVCSGDGTTARRVDLGTATLIDVVCVGPEACNFVHSGTAKCSLKLRLRAQLDLTPEQTQKMGEHAPRPEQLFEFQSNSINTLRTLTANLMTLQSVYGSLTGLPVELVSFEKSSAVAEGETFHVARLQSHLVMPTPSGDGNASYASNLYQKLAVAIEKIDADSNPLEELEVSTLMPPAVFKKMMADARDRAKTNNIVSDLVDKARMQGGISPELTAKKLEPIHAEVAITVLDVASSDLKPASNDPAVDAKSKPVVQKRDTESDAFENIIIIPKEKQGTNADAPSLNIAGMI